MQRLRYLFAILGLAACLAAGVYAHAIRNPWLAIVAIIVAGVATTIAVRYFSKHVAAPNLEAAKTQPAIRSGPFAWALQFAMMLVTVGIASFLFMSQNQAEIPDYPTYRLIACGLAAAGVVLVAIVIVLFKAANRS